MRRSQRDQSGDVPVSGRRVKPARLKVMAGDKPAHAMRHDHNVAMLACRFLDLG